jgi:hypothetical protein
MAVSQPFPLSIREDPALELSPEPLPVSAGLTFRAVGLGAVLCILLTIWTIHGSSFPIEKRCRGVLIGVTYMISWLIASGLSPGIAILFLCLLILV